MFEEQKQFPLWLGGILVAVVLLGLTTLFRPTANPVLQQRFTVATPDPNQPTSQALSLPSLDLPSGMSEQIARLRSTLNSGGSIPALTPVATGSAVELEVTSLKRNGEQVQIAGEIRNTGQSNLDVPLSAFSFQDSDGVAYAIEGDGQTTIGPSEAAPFNLEVPLPPERGLVLILSLSSEPPIEQVLLAPPQ